MHGHDHQVSLGFSPDLYPAGTHICYLLNDEQEWSRIVPPYIRSGLEGGESVEYFADVSGSDMLDPVFESIGMAGSSQASTDGFAVARAVDKYCPDGRFVPERMLSALCDIYDRACAAGFAGARVTGEMTWALRGVPGSERLIEYEAQINTMLREHPLTVLCQYDTRKFDGGTIFEVLNVHPMLIVHGQILRNPFYIPPDQSLRAKSGESGGA